MKPKYSKYRKTRKKPSSKSRERKKDQRGGSKTKTIRKNNIVKTPKSISTAQSYCSPYANKSRLSNHSCFTKDNLKTLVDGYNAKYSHDPIQPYENTTTGWNTLQNKMNKYTTCKNDLCWMDSLNLPENTKVRFKNKLYRPVQPSIWKSNPNQWLTNLDIKRVLNQYEEAYPSFRFLGPTPLDFDTKLGTYTYVCNKVKNLNLEQEYKNNVRKIGVVFNEDKYGKSGSHWTAFFIDLDDNFIIYFNSGGNNMLKSMTRFRDMVRSQAKTLFGRKMKYIQNHHVHQKGKSECGMYCLYFIIALFLRKIDILANHNTNSSTVLQQGGSQMSLKEILTYFTKQRIPDKFVMQYRDFLFRKEQ